MNAGVSHPSVTFLLNAVPVIPDSLLTGCSRGFLCLLLIWLVHVVRDFFGGNKGASTAESI